MSKKEIAIIGGGPAGLMAAETLSALGSSVTVYEAMPTVGRKFLLAGKSGLNITHSEDQARFLTRFGDASGRLKASLDSFTPDDIQAWAAGLGVETFVGSSGRVFPRRMKASPLLRAWLKRLEGQGARVLTRHRWEGFAADGGLVFQTPDGMKIIRSDAALLALGGASWPKLGSDGAWTSWLKDRGVEVNALRPANCGFDIDWSESFKERFAGVPVKSVTAISKAGAFQGEFVITRNGIEGGLVYMHAAALRDQLEKDGTAVLELDLAPGRTVERLARDLVRQDAKASFSSRLRKGAGFEGVKAALVREIAPDAGGSDPEQLARLIKAMALPIFAPRPIAEAISSAGGITWDSIDDNYMLNTLPGVFAAGEMLDWEAPTGGYLLSACLATGRTAARGIYAWLETRGGR